MASDGTRLYLAGGFSSADSAPRSVYAYSPADDGWSELTQVPEGVNHAPFVFLDGRLYLVGGYRGASFEATDALRIYDLATDRWHDGPPMPTPRGAHAVAVHNGRLHAIGGVDADGRNTGAHEVYDPRTDSWSAAADLPTPRDHLAAAAVGGEIIVLAGRDSQTFTLTVNEIYDPTSDSWRDGAPVPTGRSGVAAAVADDQVCLMGGETMSPRMTFDEAECYDPASDTWIALPVMRTPRHGLGAGTIGGAIHVVSGGPGAGLTFSGVHELLRFDGIDPDR